MTDKELMEVSKRAWNACVDQLPKEITGRDLLAIITCFIVYFANAVDMKPTTVCTMMHDSLNAKRHSVKAVNSVEGTLWFISVVTLIAGIVCAFWINYQFVAEMFGVSFICAMACWVLEFVMKVIDRWIEFKG